MKLTQEILEESKETFQFHLRYQGASLKAKMAHTVFLIFRIVTMRFYLVQTIRQLLVGIKYERESFLLWAFRELPST